MKSDLAGDIGKRYAHALGERMAKDIQRFYHSLAHPACLRRKPNHRRHNVGVGAVRSLVGQRQAHKMYSAKPLR